LRGADLAFGFVVAVQDLRRFLVLGDAVAVVPAGGHHPREVQRLVHGQRGGVLVLLVHVTGDLADEVLAAVGGIPVVQDLAVEVGGSHVQLPRQGFQKCGLACIARRSIPS
jgi:hypothetical protein